MCKCARADVLHGNTCPLTGDVCLLALKADKKHNKSRGCRISYLRGEFYRSWLTFFSLIKLLHQKQKLRQTPVLALV